MFAYFSYRDAGAAIAWLEAAFGFETVVAYPDENGAIVHAEKRFGGGVLMMGTAEPPPVVDPEGYEWSFGSYAPGQAWTEG